VDALYAAIGIAVGAAVSVVLALIAYRFFVRGDGARAGSTGFLSIIVPLVFLGMAGWLTFEYGDRLWDVITDEAGYSESTRDWAQVTFAGIIGFWTGSAVSTGFVALFKRTG
jgi:hypothetical protein